MIVYAVRELIPYESMDIIKLFSTMEKAADFIANADAEAFYELSIDTIAVE